MTSYLGTRSLRQLERLGLLALIGGAAAGAYILQDLELVLAFWLVLLASAAPAYLWLRSGGVGLPILPITALGYFVYYGMPIINAEDPHYTPAAVLAAAVTVALFLGGATLSWRLIAFRHSARFDRDRAIALGRALPNIMMSALLFAAAFKFADKEGWLAVLGSFYGTLNALALSAAAVGCFLYGTALGQRLLTPGQRHGGALLIAVLTILQITTLIMHGAIIFLAAALIGFVLAAKRIPWIAVVMFVTATSLLHMAEKQEREEYWTRADPDVPVLDMPSMLAGWVGSAVSEAVNGTANEKGSLAARATQLSTLLLVQEETPQNEPFLEGVTYANFPRMVVPRFILPDKPISQVNANLLSVYYHLQLPGDSQTTTLAWNLVPEAYANFGNTGALICGLVFGLLTGVITFFASGAPIISFRGLMGLAALVTLLDVEYDFSYLLLNLLQSMFSIGAFFFILKYLEPRHETYPLRAHRGLVR